MRNTSYSWLAKNRPQAVVLKEDLDRGMRDRIDEASAQDETPETVLIAKIEAQEIRKAVGALPIPFREVLVLREIHGLDYRSIAEVSDIPIGTVMSRLARARKLLMAAVSGGGA